jgi:ketosteroid isomerase-like protein
VKNRKEGVMSMRRSHFAMLAGVALLVGCATAPPRPTTAELQKQVADTERGFARTMAERDYAAFVAFIADDAVFFDGPTPLRGKQAVAQSWKPFYEKPDAPFSWEPGSVEVLESGTLAMSSGPVRDPSGRTFATFLSIWRQEAPGVWRIVFDKGAAVCDCAKP